MGRHSWLPLVLQPTFRLLPLAVRQLRPDACQQLVALEGLGHVVVGAQVQAAHHVLLLRLRASGRRNRLEPMHGGRPRSVPTHPCIGRYCPRPALSLACPTTGCKAPSISPLSTRDSS